MLRMNTSPPPTRTDLTFHTRRTSEQVRHDNAIVFQAFVVDGQVLRLGQGPDDGSCLYHYVLRLAVTAALALSAGSAFAQSTVATKACEPAPARAMSVQGTVEARRADEAQWQPVKLNDTFCPGDAIRVQDRSRADLALLNQSVLRLNANSAITVEAPKERSTGVVDLVRGAIHFFSRGPGSLEVKTSFTVAGVRGTEFFISLEPQRTLLTVFEGTVVAENAAGSLTLRDGQSAIAEAGKAPVTHIVARPRDAVHWALYYPPVLYFRPEEFPAGTDWQGMVRRSAESYLGADLQSAFEQIEKAPEDVRDARLYTYRAHLLLAVGQVDAARADIQRALEIAPNDANAASLQTIMAIVQGDKDSALQIAQRAVSAAPESATARIALSYAQQARFDLPGARADVEKAVELDPHNALAWARLAELHSSFGDLDKAMAAAQRAVELEPNLARTQTVLGFAHLMLINTRQAQETFEKAIALDQADPLPRLGLGLAKIRDGKLDEGSRELEVAASLDPSNALVRSYLGKAYYEEKRSPLDEREYRVAKQLDPRDPTPWFYDAIQKQTTNRPVEALQDIETAIELNDNRAVYRSQLLLDSDEAARSASQARVYSDLGFQELALVEGWKSVNIDQTNFSAHRFLADSYAAMPRHEIARVSELLQSQLLQPLNMTPIQPRLAESNLFLISAAGPAALSSNEFNPLFNRDGVTLQATGLAGENNTRAGEGVVAGISGKLSFSLGYTQFETDGWRTNSDQDDQLANAFLQLELTPDTSVQAEYRYRDLEHGDLGLRFLPQNFFPSERTTEERHTARLGARHAFSPGSIVLGSFMYQDVKFGVQDDQPPGLPFGFSSKRPEQAYSAELQHLLRSRYFNLTTGVGSFNINGRIDLVLGPGLPPPFPISTTTSTDLNHANVYAYSYINLLKDVTFTVGLSADLLSGDSPDVGDKDQINPKLGITWQPLPATTVRAAAFKVLKRTLITDQTLEPTQVAGFNQFFDDANGTEAWRYGAAIDQKLGRNVFAGVEYSARDLTVPFLDFTVVPDGQVAEVDWDEQLSRAYLFWTPHPWWALRAQYAYEHFDRDAAFAAGVRELDTHRVPLGISFFHPSGFSASLTGTYWNQQGEFEDFAPPGGFQPGRDDFWLFDAAISYRLPKRSGFITVGATNLFGTEFQFFDVDFDNPTIQPDRMIFARLTLELR